MLAAFATSLEAHSALEAELMAIHHGLTLALDFGRPIWVESDAAQAVKLLNGSSWGPAYTSRILARIAIQKSQQITRTTFIHREGNKGADLLAKMGIESPESLRMNTSTAPRILKAIVRLEAMGVPNIRVQAEDED
ncbi:uncharacterized protein LOC121749504 [Salvia splendens]|uniref:uncharacterized protein LOC121749504 n=1 Tax=Salvia splendens TaxID=180675 RepID=UPI001C2686F4|nr:uncharacterized protein LOC121749504 [Salvia splendens]